MQDSSLRGKPPWLPQGSTPLKRGRRRGSSPTPATSSCPPGVSSAIGQLDLTLLGAPCRIAQRLEDVLALQIWIVGQKLIDAATGADLRDDHSDRDSQAADARL